MRRPTRAAAVFTLLALAPASADMDGFVAYFTGACPPGWSLHGALAGRLLLAVNNSFQAGATSGFALADGEDRAHAHGVQGALALPAKSLAALGGSNAQAAHAGAQPLLPWLNVSAPAPSGFPLVQLTACRFAALSLQPPPALPAGGVALWDAATATAGCAAGSVPLRTDSGRLLALGGGGAPWRAGGGPPLQPGAARAHAHAFSATIDLAAVDFAGIAGCCDDAVARAGSAVTAGATAGAADGLPYAAVLACNATAGGGAAALPPGAVLLSAAAGGGCPAGWAPLADALSDRFVVGTPAHGLPSRAFGAPPVPRGAAFAPAHAHAFSAAIDLYPVGVELASGCCARGYGRAGAYEAAGVTAPTGAGDAPAYLFLTACVHAT